MQNYMQIRKVGESVNWDELPRPTDQEMQSEYNYLLAELLTMDMLCQDLIYADEFNKIMAKNRRSFSPFIAKLYSK